MYLFIKLWQREYTAKDVIQIYMAPIVRNIKAFAAWIRLERRSAQNKSSCEHHRLHFIGKYHVAYIPNGQVLGLSNVARVVDMFSRRLQIQETLAQQIASTIQEVPEARGVGVILEAKHMCMMMRGVEKQNSTMKTSSMLGQFRTDQGTRTEFLTLLNQ